MANNNDYFFTDLNELPDEECMIVQNITQQINNVSISNDDNDDDVCGHYQGSLPLWHSKKRHKEVENILSDYKDEFLREVRGIQSETDDNNSSGEEYVTNMIKVEPKKFSWGNMECPLPNLPFHDTVTVFEKGIDRRIYLHEERAIAGLIVKAYKENLFKDIIITCIGRRSSFKIKEEFKKSLEIIMPNESANIIICREDYILFRNNFSCRFILSNGNKNINTINGISKNSFYRGFSLDLPCLILFCSGLLINQFIVEHLLYYKKRWDQIKLISYDMIANEIKEDLSKDLVEMIGNKKYKLYMIFKQIQLT
jgi:hypothetical protein